MSDHRETTKPRAALVDEQNRPLSTAEADEASRSLADRVADVADRVFGAFPSLLTEGARIAALTALLYFWGTIYLWSFAEG